MTVRRGRREFRALTIAAAMAAPLLTAGCATPLTHLEWGTQRGPVPHHTSNTYESTANVIVPKPRPEPSRYAYYNDDVPVPRARPRFSWFQPKPQHDEEPSYQPWASRESFQWPVRGRVITEFGTYSDGGRNDGINIAANYGEPIRASADGTVSYSGELRSYGNLALLRHDNGYVTAYAHADHFIVGKGDHVTRGQVIGYVGSTGDVRGPQLHFELRKGARGETPVNPRPLLGPAQVASR